MFRVLTESVIPESQPFDLELVGFNIQKLRPFRRGSRGGNFDDTVNR